MAANDAFKNCHQNPPYSRYTNGLIEKVFQNKHHFISANHEILPLFQDDDMILILLPSL